MGERNDEQPTLERSAITDDTGCVIGHAESVDEDEAYVSLVRISRLMC